MNSVKAKLAGSQPVVMVNLGFNSPALVEFFGGSGVDAVMLDCERTSASIERVEEMARAARAAGIVSVVRPEQFDRALVTRYLDCRVGGLIVPHVETGAAAQAIVEVVRYARPSDFQDLLIIAMIESVLAIGALDEILSVEGIDVFFVARVDLSKSLGLGGDKFHPDLVRVASGAVQRIRSAGRYAGTGGDFENVQHALEGGAQLVLVSTQALLRHGLHAYRALMSSS